jgi:ABC-type dipeptide/oligopeptide/nickel transport system permease component
MLRFTFGLPIVLAPLVIALFAISLKWFPPTGWGTRSPFVWGFIPSNLFSAAFWRYAILACAVLGLSGAAAVAQLARVGAWDAWQSEQVRVARALRLGERAITLHYVLRPALASVLAGLGWMFMALVAANLIVEWVFGIPGMGRYFIMSIINRDYPVIQNSLVFSALILLSITVFFDVLRAWLDPRVRRVTTKNA